MVTTFTLPLTAKIGESIEIRALDEDGFIIRHCANWSYVYKHGFHTKLTYIGRIRILNYYGRCFRGRMRKKKIPKWKRS